MRIELRSDSVMLDGYVNAVARDSVPIITAAGRCVEQIEPRAFQRALERTDNVNLLFNHHRKLGSTKEKNVELFEDNIGLRAVCLVTDPEVIQKARERRLRGWSFGMLVKKDHIEERSGALPRRHVEDLDLYEVSIVDYSQSPCYAGTSIEQRSDGEIATERRTLEFQAVIEDYSETQLPNYTEFEDKIKKLKECV